MTDSPLRLLLGFDAQAQRDKSQSLTFLHRRDRKFALICEEQGVDPNAALWLAHLNRLSGPDTTPSAADQTLGFWRRVHAGFAAVGLITGLLTMAGLLFYDGGQRINITVLLGFVLLQLILALFTSLQSLVGWQPWRWLLRRFRTSPANIVISRLHPLLMARAAHIGGLCFAISGLATLLVLVVVQDLAFGWSTTLETAAANYHRLVQIIAVPWTWLWPAAVPDLALVEATRFFRAGIDNASPDPGLWGQWWPFVTMLWTTWVLLPRLLMWLVTSALIRNRARRLLSSHPAMHALLYRMETPALDTGNEHNDADDLPDTRARDNLLPLPESDTLLCWAGAGEPELPEALRSGRHLILRAGGRASLTDDEQTLKQVAEHCLKTRGNAVILLTRCWEPPTGELQDFLESARRLWPGGIRVALVPLAADTNLEPDAQQIQPWLRFAERVGNEFVRVSLPPLLRQFPYTTSGEPS
ncbi:MULTISPECIES: DUF2868 domain-containing protein [Marinobacter]|uniref:DUF2868 domain-containing protein n=1 Tax=Marinobacter metalliresistant TaxID=2961995 RepID=A0ABZ2VXM0_9GAMM|nr:DUF2868 domain-containing protein [Marinobacter sp. Arc7-DN-1]AXS83722.1 DUF2868 domain-containing protein [Marinobacter sp. Arc7-DN-1]